MPITYTTAGHYPGGELFVYYSTSHSQPSVGKCDFQVTSAKQFKWPPPEYCVQEKVIKRGTTHYLSIECTVDCSIQVGMQQDGFQVVKKQSVTDATPRSTAKEVTPQDKYNRQVGESFNELVDRLAG